MAKAKYDATVGLPYVQRPLGLNSDQKKKATTAVHNIENRIAKRVKKRGKYHNPLSQGKGS